MMRARLSLFAAIFSFVGIQPGLSAPSQPQCTDAGLKADASATIEACAIVLREPDPPAAARVRALVIRGVGFFHLAQYDKSIAEFEAAIAIDPQNPKLKVNAGLIALHMDDVPKAAALAQEAVRLAPRSAGPFNLLGGVFIRYRQFNAAKAAFDRALQIEPNNPQYRFSMFDLFVRLRMQREAVQEADKLLKLPDEAIAEVNSAMYEWTSTSFKTATRIGRARLLQAMGRFPEAEAAYDETIRDDPSALAYTARTQFYLQREIPAERIIADLERARALDPHFWLIYDVLGRVHFYAKRYDAAVKTFAQEVALKPNKGRARWWHAVSLRAADRLEDAKGEALSALDVDPDFVLRIKGKTLRELGFLPPAADGVPPHAHVRDAVVACMIDQRCW